MHVSGGGWWFMYGVLLMGKYIAFYSRGVYLSIVTHATAHNSIQ